MKYVTFVDCSYIVVARGGPSQRLCGRLLLGSDILQWSPRLLRGWGIDALITCCFYYKGVTSLSDQVQFDIDHIVYIQVTLFIIVELADYHCWL